MLEFETREPESINFDADIPSVISVNGKTGYVNLKTSDIPNDSNYVTSNELQEVVSPLVGAITALETRIATLEAHIQELENTQLLGCK